MNKNELFVFTKKIITFAAGGIFLRLIPFLTTPLLLQVLSPEDYGISALLQSSISFIVIFSGFGLRQALFINFFHFKSRQRKEMINDLIAVYIALISPVLLLCLANKTTLSLFISNHINENVIFLMCLICFLSFFAELYYQILMLDGYSTKLVILQCISGLITAAINVISIITFQLNYIGLLIGQLAGLSITVVVGLSWYYRLSCYKYFNLRRSLNSLRTYLADGFLFIPSMFFGWILSSSNRWFLAHYSTLYNVGIYSLADSIGQLYQLIIMLPLNNTYVPMIMKKYSENPDTLLAIESWNKRNLKIFFSVSSVIAIIMYVLGTFAIKLLIPIKYHDVMNYIGFVLLGYIFWTGTTFTFALIFYLKKTFAYLLILLTTCLVNIVLNWLLIYNYKIYGCLFSTLITYFVYFALSMYYNTHVQENLNIKREIVIT